MSNKHAEYRYGGAGRGLRYDTFTPHRIKVQSPAWSSCEDSSASIPGFHRPQNFAGEKSNGEGGGEAIYTESPGTADGTSTDKLLLRVFSTRMFNNIRYVDES